MFDFIWHLRGSVALRAAQSNDVVLDSLERLLEKQRKRNRKRGLNRTEFDDPLWSDFLGPNWLAMRIYDRGCFWIEDVPEGRRLYYTLRSLHGMVFCLIAAFLAIFFGLAGGGNLGGVRFATGAFACLYGINVLLAVLRVPLAIRRAVAKV